MRTVRPRRSNVRGLATLLLALTTVVALAGCGADDPRREGRDGRDPKPPRTESTQSATPTGTPTPTTSPSGTPGSTTTPAPTPTPTPTEAPKPPKTVKIKIKEGVIKGAPAKLAASIGQTIQIEILSDVADELQVFEQTFPIPADEKVTVEFVVPAEPGPGTYAVELNVSGQLLFGLEVR